MLWMKNGRLLINALMTALLECVECPCAPPGCANLCGEETVASSWVLTIPAGEFTDPTVYDPEMCEESSGVGPTCNNCDAMNGDFALQLLTDPVERGIVRNSFAELCPDPVVGDLPDGASSVPCFDFHYVDYQWCDILDPNPEELDEGRGFQILLQIYHRDAGPEATIRDEFYLVAWVQTFYVLDRSNPSLSGAHTTWRYSSGSFFASDQFCQPGFSLPFREKCDSPISTQVCPTCVSAETALSLDGGR